jgi:hypothetical protein
MNTELQAADDAEKPSVQVVTGRALLARLEGVQRTNFTCEQITSSPHRPFPLTDEGMFEVRGRNDTEEEEPYTFAGHYPSWEEGHNVADALNKVCRLFPGVPSQRIVDMVLGQGPGPELAGDGVSPAARYSPEEPTAEDEGIVAEIRMPSRRDIAYPTLAAYRVRIFNAGLACRDLEASRLRPLPTPQTTLAQKSAGPTQSP